MEGGNRSCKCVRVKVIEGLVDSYLRLRIPIAKLNCLAIWKSQNSMTFSFRPRYNHRIGQLSHRERL